MDKNAIKKYAVWARRELISRVSQKAMQYGITENEIVPANAASVNGVVLSADEIKQRKALIDRIKAKGYEQVMEEVAYTWFNRFIALRFMEVNGYLPSHVRVFTDEENNFKPQILAEAINLELDGLDMDKVYALKDANNNDALFKYLIIVQCNALNPILPRMFQEISDYTELLFPDNLLRDGSVVEQMISMIPEEDWTDQVQIIGWLYQFYNIEPKAAVFAKNGKISKEEIPAATQLFTPDWIVRYMVENSLGRLWVERNAGTAKDDYDEYPGDVNELLISKWKYYLPEAEQEPEVQAQLTKIRKEYASLTPEQIKCIDPCAGSGHILAYMFDVLMQIYETYGYTTREAVRSIIENNIYGLDIDDRAAQLAYFAVMMKARQYDRRFLTRKDEDNNPDVPQPRVYAIKESNGIDAHALEYFINGDPKLKKAIDSIIREMRDAKEYGSILNITPVDFEALYARFEEVADDISLSKEAALCDILPLVQVAEALALKYDVVVTNPPYMSVSAGGPKLNQFVKDHYPDSKADLFAVFIEKCRQMCKTNGLQGMITMHSWMFLTSFENLRVKLLNLDSINMAHLGTRAFEEIGGEVVQTTSFVLRHSHVEGYKSKFLRLTEPNTQQGKEELFLTGENQYVVRHNDFLKIPGNPFAYWVSIPIMKTFDSPQIGTVEYPKQGLSSADNNRFLRYWFEVEHNNFRTDCFSNENSAASHAKWFPFNKGGEFRKWYGNFDYVINWKDNGFELRNFKNAAIRNPEFYFMPHITWSKVCSSNISFRYRPAGSVFSDAGCAAVFNKETIWYALGLLNTKYAQQIFNLINPTINYTQSTIASLPYIESEREYVSSIVWDNIELCRLDWDAFETSWDFQRHPLVAKAKKSVIKTNGVPSHRIADAYDHWDLECDTRFAELKANEEELNRIFIDIYGLQDELTPEVEDKDVTVRKADLKRDIKSLISYAVGCMFGRYSLDVPGLVYAGGEWDDSKYVTFKADKDNIIPICDNDYFEDDIVGRFVRFIEVVYGKETLDENLKFIADALGGSGQPKDVIRKYFMDEFYADHLKTYQKRPIYWMFDSGKKGGFRALIYMHRYQPDTIARIRTDYVHEQQSRYLTAIADLEQRIATASTSERVKLNKQLKKLKEQSEEIHKYEEKIHHLADQYIAIDLDDGVKVNYAKVQDVLAKIK